MTTEPIPALILANLRRILTLAARRGQKIDPRTLLDMIEGKRKA